MWPFGGRGIQSGREQQTQKPSSRQVLGVQRTLSVAETGCWGGGDRSDHVSLKGRLRGGLWLLL